jgi:hypothetical protein
MVFPLVGNTTDLDEMRKYIPGLGEKGASLLQEWGHDASNKESLKLSTVAEITETAGEPLQGFVDSGKYIATCPENPC